MGRVSRAAAVATSLGLGGCLVVNGAFQAAEGDGSGAATSTGTTVVTGGDTSTGGSSTGGASEGSGGASTGSSSSSSSDASSSGPGVDESTSTSTTDATTSSSSTGPELCPGTEGDLCTSQPIGGQTYLLCDKHQTWEEARLACEARCARLVILDAVKSAALFTELRAQMTDADKQEEMSGVDQIPLPRASWWIGGHKVDGAYQWLDATPMPPKGTGGWNSNDPDIDSPEGCVVLVVYGKGEGGNGKWFDRPCGEVPYRAICEPL